MADQNQSGSTLIEQYPAGTFAPQTVGAPPDKQEGVPAADPGKYGDNNEQLPELYWKALLTLARDYKMENPVSRRNEVKRVRQAKEFWKGLQYIYWHEGEQLWHLPFEERASDDGASDEPRYTYVTNYFQGYGLSIIAVLSQDTPKTRLAPQNADQDEDVATAKAGTTIIELVERNNRLGSMMQDEAFELWTGGKVAGYVRYVVDGQRFGFHDEDEMAETQAKMGEDAYLCHACGAETPANQFWGVCPQCGAEMDDSNFSQAPLVKLPKVQNVTPTPNGQEVMSLHGALEVTTPAWANHQHQFPYLIWEVEAHVSELKTAFPSKADQIGQSTAGDGDQSLYDRLARISISTGGQVTEAGDINKNLITFRRTWLRPWAFAQVQDKTTREGLMKLFPRGCYLAQVGDVYVESRNESMDDHWRVMHALPGDGQDRNALGTSSISINERINTIDNITIETTEHGIPPTYAFSDVLDWDSLPNAQVEPGAFYEVTKGSVQRVQDGIYTPEPAKVSPDATRHREMLAGQAMQFMSGAFPALFGGSMENNDTASGYAMARNQALGRVGLVWRRMKFFHADLELLAVDCFRKNRAEDVQMTVQGAAGQFENKWVRMADLRGNIFAYPDTDEQYPTQWAEQQAVLMKLMESQDPKIQEILGSPENISLVKRLIGLEDLKIPSEASRVKQYREIAEMLQSAPTEGLVTGPTGVQMPGMVPSVMPDVEVDINEDEAEACQYWLISDAGQATKLENPNGYLNVRMHFLIHKQAATAQMMAEQAAAAGPAPGKEPAQAAA